MFSATRSDELARCRQILCEFHDLRKLGQARSLSLFADVFAKLNGTHAVVHVHANNCCNLLNIQNVAVPDTIEVTYASRAHYTFEPTDEVFPGPLDAPNLASRPDIWLGSFRF